MFNKPDIQCTTTTKRSFHAKTILLQTHVLISDKHMYYIYHVCLSIYVLGSVPAIGAAFGQSSFSVVAANFSCNGLESNITSCSYTATSNCGHHEDAGVYCNVKCTDGDVRLANGTDQYEGRVEVCSNATWHTVCENGWSNEDAEVTCRNLGFTAISK